MVSNEVALVSCSLKNVRVSRYPIPDNEKRGLHVVGRQNVQQLGSAASSQVTHTTKSAPAIARNVHV